MKNFSIQFILIISQAICDKLYHVNGDVYEGKLVEIYMLEIIFLEKNDQEIRNTWINRIDNCPHCPAIGFFLRFEIKQLRQLEFRDEDWGKA